MIKLALSILAVAGLFSAALVYAQGNVSAELDKPFELKFSQEAIIDSENISIRFINFIQDSRCPSDVVCIWEGQATIRVSVEVDGTDAGQYMLTIGADPSPSAAFGQYSVTLLGLEPYPVSTVETDRSDYVATLVVSKAPANSAGVFVRAFGAQESGSVAVISGWNLERGKGTLVLLSRDETGTKMSVARFTPAAVPCIGGQDARECIDGQVVQAVGNIRQGETIHLEVSRDTLFLAAGDSDYSLHIKRIRTDTQSAPTVELREGQREGPLLVQEIGADYVSGLNFVEYPVAISEGMPITLHVGDKTTNGCTVTLTLLEIREDSALFSKVVDENRPCPICWHKTA